MSTTSSKKEFEKLLSAPQEEKWREVVEFRKANKDWLTMSADIAMKVMDAMERLGIKGNELAKRMDVSPQQVSKILKGRENLKLETIAKLNKALGVKLITIMEEDEIVIKNDMKSLMKMLTKEMLRQHITKELQEVTQQPKEVKVPKQPTIEQEFAFASGYVTAKTIGKIKAGEENYALAA